MAFNKKANPARLQDPYIPPFRFGEEFHEPPSEGGYAPPKAGGRNQIGGIAGGAGLAGQEYMQGKSRFNPAAALTLDQNLEKEHFDRWKQEQLVNETKPEQLHMPTERPGLRSRHVGEIPSDLDLGAVMGSGLAGAQQGHINKMDDNVDLLKNKKPPAPPPAEGPNKNILERAIDDLRGGRDLISQRTGLSGGAVTGLGAGAAALGGYGAYKALGGGKKKKIEEEKEAMLKLAAYLGKLAARQ